MANENAQLAEFADNLWNNYIKQKYKDECKGILTYYRATVVSNDGSNRLTIQRPFDTAYQVSCTDAMSAVTAGTNVTVLVFGDGINNSNHIVVAYSNGNTPSQVPDPTVTWETPTSSGATLATPNGGGYYIEGKHVYVTISCNLNEATTSGSNVTLFTDMPIPAIMSPLTTMIANDLRGIVWVNTSGELHLRPTANVSTSNYVTINGHYTLAYEEPEITVDSALSTVSTNPVQNKVVTLALQDKADITDVPVGIPSGGTAGQMLKKTSNTDYDIGWG